MNEGTANGGDSNGTAARPKRARSGPLSNREREVFELLADGLSGAQIAQRLVLSPETVRTHIRNAMGKLGASTRSQALVLALRQREIAPRGGIPAAVANADADTNATSLTVPVRADEVSGPLEAALEDLISLWDVDAGWIYLTDDDGLALGQVAQRAGAGAGLPETIALGEGALGRAALERRSQVLQTPGSESGAMVVTPLIDGSKLVGVLGLAIRSSRATGRQELLLLQALGTRMAELIQKGGPRLDEGMKHALAGFRSSWATGTRPL